MDIWWSLHLRREPASVPLARHILLGTMASAGVDPDISHEVGVALTEACANAVEHARHTNGAGQDSGFQVTATIEDGCLRVEITDNGPGFSADPRCASPAPGLPASAAPTRIRPCVARGRHRRRMAPALVRPLAVVGPDLGDLEGLEDLEDFEGFQEFDGLAPFLGIPDDAGSCLPDLDATSGRGLFLIRALMDHVQFRNHPRSGAVVSFDKVLKFRERPLLHAS
ncbi:ATP-binding protein [Streptacidiphilus sp. N1-12]|uniref:ATP-binding protein n=2 Tax=Streptacidiphilus alkalitolerans TaxID=3342712 RepID=A0ABV6WF12_9ACTN